MQKNTKTIFQELASLHSTKEQKHVIESRASNVIKSAINLIELIHESYDEEIADDLERRFINSIKGKDIKKFQRGIRKTDETE